LDNVDIEIISNVAINNEVSQYYIIKNIKEMSPRGIILRLNKLVKEGYLILTEGNGKKKYKTSKKVIVYNGKKVLILLPNDNFYVCGAARNEKEIAKAMEEFLKHTK